MWGDVVKIAVAVAVAGAAVYLIVRIVRRLKQFALDWLAGHPACNEVYLDVKCLVDDKAAAIKRSADAVKIRLFGRSRTSGSPVTIVTDELVPIDKMDELIDHAKKKPILCQS